MVPAAFKKQVGYQLKLISFNFNNFSDTRKIIDTARPNFLEKKETQKRLYYTIAR